MDEDIVNKHELLRLHAGCWSRKNSATRWELMCELHDKGKSWLDMGAWISRSASTAKRLWRRGWLERQKKHALCVQCNGRFDKLTTYPRYISPRGPGVEGRCQIPSWVVFGGHCPRCKTRTWSWPFKMYSYELVWQKVTPKKGSEVYKVVDFEMVPPVGFAPTAARLKVGCSSI